MSIDLMMYTFPSNYLKVNTDKYAYYYNKTLQK